MKKAMLVECLPPLGLCTPRWCSGLHTGRHQDL